MKRIQYCFAKETGDTAGGSLQPAPAAAESPIETCPFGVPVTVTLPDGSKQVAIRSEFVPNWLDKNRDKALAAVPVSWSKV